MNSADSQATDILYPLSAFEALDGRGGTHAEILEGEELPEPYRTLLVHDRDMTGTLEAYFRQPVTLRVASKRIDGDSLYRQVVLVGVENGRPVEFGAIRIDLTVFDEETRAVVEACKVPLGRILREHKVAYVSNPSAYLRVSPDKTVCHALGAERGPLYGRKNELTTPDDRVIAQIIEILPLSDEEEAST